MPAIVLAGSIWFDSTGWLTVSTISVACVFSLVAFSFLLPSRHLIFWTLVYIIAITISLWVRRSTWAGSGGNADALVATRALVASGAGILACLLAKQREHEGLLVNEVHRVLDQMEVPVITSDQDGWIVHMNPRASEILGGQAALGSPFFDHFSVATAKSKAIRSYVDLATGSTSGPVSITLGVGPERSQLQSAIMLRVEIGERGQIMTLLYPHQPNHAAVLPVE